MGMPEFMLEFKHKAETITKRGQRGIVAVILEDSTKSGDGYMSYSITDEKELVKSHWSTKSLEYISMIFKGNPKRVLIERADAAGDYDAALARLKNKKWNWLTVPDADESGAGSIAGWLMGQRENDKKSFKAVLPNYEADYPAIVNFATDGIAANGKSYSTAEFCARIAGVLAGTALNESAVYTVLPEVTAITESTTPDEDVDNGKLILINDGQNIKLGRAVTSLTTVNDNQTEDMKKIKIVEAMDLIYEDIRDVFESTYIGMANTYDNKQLFVAELNEYFENLERQGVLEDTASSYAEIDFEAQKAWLINQGKDVTEMSDEEIKKAKTGSYIFLCGALSIMDAIEDLKYNIYI